MKRINWPVSLRMRQLHVNQFHIERSANIILLIDTFVNIGERPHSTLDFTLRAAGGGGWGRPRPGQPKGVG
jgi:uncharacterized protein (DUF58 family)